MPSAALSADFRHLTWLPGAAGAMLGVDRVPNMVNGNHVMGRLFAAISMMALLGACGLSGPGPGAELAARYCYRTLAEVDCHA